MTRISIITLAAISAAAPVYAVGQTAATAPSANVSATTPAPTLPSTATVAQTPGVTLRSLPSVLDARERRTKWQAAAEQAGNRINEPALKSQFNQRMTGLVPAVAKLLMAHPQGYAMVTVGVYRSQEAPDKQAMVAVTFDGLDSQLGPDFFADVVSGLPTIPTGEGLPTGLSLDIEATSYLVFFLGEKELEAGDIPHTTFGKSILLATNRAQKSADAQAVASTVNAERTRAAAVAPGQANQDASVPATVPNNGSATNGYTDGQTGNNVVTANPYGYGYNYPLVNDGYYYPGVGVPLVIVPGEVQTTPENQRRQAEREQRLERDYQSRLAARPNTNVNPAARQSAAGAANNGAVGASPGTGTVARSGTAVGSSPATGTPGPGQSASNAGGNLQGPHPAVNFPAPGQPGGAPAGATASNERAPSTTSGPNGSSPSATPHPAAGAPGGPPAAKK